MKRGRKTSQTGKAFIMKKSTLVSLIAMLNGEAITDQDTIKAELEAELNRGKEKAAANKALYETYHVRVMNTLRGSTNPLSAQEIADETGIARGKVVYGLTSQWADEVVKDTTGKTTLYRIKV